MSLLSRLFGKDKETAGQVTPIRERADEELAKAILAEAGDALLLQADVIPDVLVGRVFGHELEFQDTTVDCLTYLSKGLVKVGHPEIRLTLKREDKDSFWNEPFTLFRNVYDQAQAGNVVDSYQLSWFGEDVIGFRGIIYTSPTPIFGINTPPATLAGHMIKQKEVQEYQSTIALRVLTRIGKHYWYYPWPPFSDAQRPDLGEDADEAGFIGKIGRVWAAPAYVSKNRERITLSLPSEYAETLSEQLAEVPQGVAVALATGLDPGAHACLTWRHGQTQPEAITGRIAAPIGSSRVLDEEESARVAGAFLAFAPGVDRTHVATIEDGFAAALTDLDWQRVKQAIATGERVLLEPAGDSLELAVEWREQMYYNPVDDVTCVADWTTYEPFGGEDEGPRDSRFQVQTRLLTSQTEIAQRIKVQQLGDFLIAADKHITALLDEYDGDGRLVAQFDCSPDVQIVRVAHQGNIPPGLVQQIETELGWMDKLGPSGDVSFQLEIGIAGKDS